MQPFASGSSGIAVAKHIKMYGWQLLYCAVTHLPATRHCDWQFQSVITGMCLSTCVPDVGSINKLQCKSLLCYLILLSGHGFILVFFRLQYLWLGSISCTYIEVSHHRFHFTISAGCDLFYCRLQASWFFSTSCTL